MRKRLLFTSLAILAAAVAAWFIYRAWSTRTPVSTAGQRIVAEVNGRPISADTFSRKYSRFTGRLHIPPGGVPNGQELKTSYLNKLIETELLLQEAERRGITVTDQELDREINRLKEDYPKDALDQAFEGIGLKLDEWREERREKLLIDKLIQQEVDSRISIGDGEIAAYYKERMDDFKRPLMVRARQIVVATEEEAHNLRERLLKGEDFAELAREFSLSPDAENGGDLGFFAQGQMPEEFDEAAFQYRVGSLSRVVQSPYGYHIFLVEDRVPPRTLALEEVRETIAATLFAQRQEAVFNDWINALKNQARIAIHSQALAEIP